MANKYQVWWLGGNLNKDEERRRYNQFGNTLAEVFAGVATVNDHFRGNYEFKWHQRCTKEDFRKLWSKPSTAGILWHSHGDLSATPPAAMAYHHYIDGPPDALPPADDTALHLIPKKLGSSTRSLRLLGLFYCYSAASYHEWAKVIPAKAVIVATLGLRGADWDARSSANFNKWAWDECRKMRDFAFRRSWKDYRRYEERLEGMRLRSPMQVKQGRAKENAWLFFKYLVYSGPAGPPPEKRSWWEIHCSRDVKTGPYHAERIPGPLGQGGGGARPQKPLGMA